MRRLAIVAAVVIAVAMTGGGWVLSARIGSNCEGIHRIVKVGGEIIADGKKDLRQYVKDGLLTQEQYDRAVAATNLRLQRWNAADCK